MKFRLVYEGELRSSGNNAKRPGHKHDIRRVLRQQLEELWRVDPNLNDWTESGGYRTRPEWEKIADQYEKWGVRWVPLITEANFTHCSLDILLLRPGKVGGLIVDTDIDNRLKTLFDALQIPTSDKELGPVIIEEDPFWVLMEKDSLISSVKVTTDRLLASDRAQRVDIPERLVLQADQSINVNHAMVVIFVELQKTKNTMGNIHLA